MGGGEGEDDAADEGHARGDAGCEPEEEGDHHATLADVRGTAGEARETGDVGEDGEEGDQEDAGTGGDPGGAVALQPGGAAQLVARLVEGGFDIGAGQGCGAADLHPAADGGGGNVLHALEPAHVALDADLAGAAGHAADRVGGGEEAGRGSRGNGPGPL